jgi:hypothetical protein
MNHLRRTLSLGLTAVNVASQALFARPVRRVNQRTLWETRGSREENDGIDTDPYYRGIDALVLERLARYADGRGHFLLDVGTYQGHRLQKYSNAMRDRRFVGVDLGFRNLKFGAERYPLGSNAVTINADGRALPFRSGSADLVYTVGLLSQVPSAVVKEALREMLVVTSRYLVLVEIDCWHMKGLRRLQALRSSYIYMHKYTRLIRKSGARLLETLPLVDQSGHARYTLFVCEKPDGRSPVA